MYRDSYHVAIVGPLTETASMTYYVVVIVRTVQRGNVVVVAPNGYTQLPAKCMNVPGNTMSGSSGLFMCFFGFGFVTVGLLLQCGTLPVHIARFLSVYRAKI